jgi:lactose/cellobiose-specific phosphotransferase system IIC component
MVPYSVFSSSLILLVALFEIINVPVSMLEGIKTIHQTIHQFIPFILMISIAYHVAARYLIDRMVSIILSLAIFITIGEVLNLKSEQHEVFYGAISIWVLGVPIATVLLLRNLTKETTYFSTINSHINSTFKYLKSSLIVYIILIGIGLLSGLVLQHVSFDLGFFLKLPETILSFFNIIFIQLFWFIGLHGNNMMNILVEQAVYNHVLDVGLTYGLFHNLFLTFGGSGSVLALIFAIFLVGQDSHSNKIAKLSLPFSIFNISEIILYGLPIVFNRKMFIPFIMVPIINFILAYSFLIIYPIDFGDINNNANAVLWTAPIFLNVYILTDGNVTMMLMQLFLLILDIIIYIPFIRSYTSAQSSHTHLLYLKKSLNITTVFSAEEGYKYNKKKEDTIQNNNKVEKVIDLISDNELILYYQPIVKVNSQEKGYFEALLRLRLNNEKILPPIFLEQIEKAGLAHIIDIWVAQEIKNNLGTWKNRPTIAMNIHPNTLENDDAIKQIMDILDGEKIKLEIIERGLLDNEVAIRNVFMMSKAGFEIVIDDFGNGYSNFDLLYKLPIDTVKIDKSLTDNIETKKSYIIIKNITSLLKDLSFHSVIEGVETNAQVEIIQTMDIDYIQGYFYSRPIPLDKAKIFNLQFNNIIVKAPIG